MRLAAIAFLTLLLCSRASAQGIPLNPNGPVVAPDKGWVSTIWAGPACDFFLMQPSGRTWAIPRGTPMHDGVLAGAQSNHLDWYLYKLQPALFNGVAPLVVVSASTSPPLAGSAHPGYDEVVTYQNATTVCGGANGAQPATEAAIAILPASSY